MIFSFGGRNGGDDHGKVDPAAFAQVRGYWEALRRGDKLPHRGQIDPRGLGGTLDRVFLAEEIAPGMARLRLAGQALCDLMGMEVRGMPLSALFEPASRRTLEVPMAQVFGGRHVATVELTAETGIGRPRLVGRMVLLPVEGFSGRPDLALGCVAFAGDIGRTPRRLIVARAVTEALLAPGLPEPGMLEAAEEAATFTPAPPQVALGDEAPVRRAPHLRLVKSD